MRQLPSLIHRYGYRRVFVVTDCVLVANRLLDRVVGPLRDAVVDVSVFDGGEPEPSLKNAASTLEKARKVAPDVIVGLGAGSNAQLQ